MLCIQTRLCGNISTTDQIQNWIVDRLPPDPNPATGTIAITFLGSLEQATATGWTNQGLNSLWRYQLTGVVRGATPSTYVKGSDIILSGTDAGLADRVEANRNFQPFNPIKGY
jgi:hypothetical protein